MEKEFLVHVPIVAYAVIKVKAESQEKAEHSAMRKCDRINLIDSNGYLIKKHKQYKDVDGWYNDCIDRANFTLSSKII